MGVDVYQIDHEDANGQFEVNYTYADALTSADNFMLVKMAVSEIARKHGMIGTFMPKPFSNRTGSGAHFHISMGNATKSRTCSTTPNDPQGLALSEMAYFFLGGILKHARALAAICAPTVNSYKRLVVGRALSGATWAPAYIAYGDNNRTGCVRIPGGRLEMRLPDSGCNPYLVSAAIVAAGMDGVKNRIHPGPPNNTNLYEATPERSASAWASTCCRRTCSKPSPRWSRTKWSRTAWARNWPPSSSRSRGWNGPSTRGMSRTGKPTATWSSSDVRHRRTAAEEARLG